MSSWGGGRSTHTPGSRPCHTAALGRARHWESEDDRTSGALCMWPVTSPSLELRLSTLQGVGGSGSQYDTSGPRQRCQGDGELEGGWCTWQSS